MSEKQKYVGLSLASNQIFMLAKEGRSKGPSLGCFEASCDFFQKFFQTKCLLLILAEPKRFASIEGLATLVLFCSIFPTEEVFL